MFYKSKNKTFKLGVKSNRKPWMAGNDKKVVNKGFTKKKKEVKKRDVVRKKIDDKIR